jgi:uncharacterized protein with HEPN domain
LHPKSPLWLEDIQRASRFIQEDTGNISLDTFLTDRHARQATERNLEIIGEALRRIERVDLQTASRITDYRQIIGLRNRLIHGYDEIDDTTIWTIITTFVPALAQEVDALLAEADNVSMT